MNNTNITSPIWNNIIQWANLGTNNQVNRASQTSQINMQNSNKTTNGTTKESREAMIKRLYRTILGRDPEPNGLNYFLNNNLTEEQVAKEMYESTEHVDILKTAKDVREVILKYKEATEKIQTLENKLAATENLLQKYKTLLSEYETQKNIKDTNEEANSYQMNQNYVQEIILEDPFENSSGSKNKIVGLIKDWFKFD